ncbi:MAG: methyltransferase domain-containing protein [Nitrospirae bacterium]|nr:methyltransferase domain-containing protein [Nitrospirota bacterium]
MGVALSRRNAKVVDVGISNNMIALNRKMNEDEENYACIVGDVEAPNCFEEKSFDAIAVFFMLHRFPNINTVIKNISLWLRDGGIVWVVEPNGSNPAYKLSKMIASMLPRRVTIRLTSINEGGNYTVDDYLRAFPNCRFPCDVKASFSAPDHRKDNGEDGLKILKFIVAMRKLTFSLVRRIPIRKINQGDALILRMRRTLVHK